MSAFIKIGIFVSVAIVIAMLFFCVWGYIKTYQAFSALYYDFPYDRTR